MRSAHPYQSLPKQAFWSRAVAKHWDPTAMVGSGWPILDAADRIISAGSCFAANIVPHLETAGFKYLRTERIDEGDDRFNYARYSAAYGNIYTARQLRQLIERCLGCFQPVEDRWRNGDAIIDPFRPGLPFPAEDDFEFDLLTRAHLDRTREAFERATKLIFTLGLTEAWVSKVDGAVFPVCPGVVAGEFDADRHGFVNFRTSELIDDLRSAFARLREVNPNLRIVLTVSPVPLVATATGQHVYVANFYSKSALRAAAEEVASSEPNVVYFPSLEIVLGLDAPKLFDDDLRSVNDTGIGLVLDALFRNCEMPVFAASQRQSSRQQAEALSQLLVKKECEEGFNDPTQAQ